MMRANIGAIIYDIFQDIFRYRALPISDCYFISLRAHGRRAPMLDATATDGHYFIRENKREILLKSVGYTSHNFTYIAATLVLCWRLYVMLMLCY